MTRLLPLLLALTALLVLTACATISTPSPAETVVIAGELSYRERIALPPGSTARAFLTRNDAVIAEDVTVTAGEQVPLPFTLEVPRDALSGEGTYAVSGRIDGPDGEALFASETTDAIDPRYPPGQVGTLLLRAARP